MIQAREAYDLLKTRMREIALVGSAAELLSWDQETYMPSKAIKHRANQLAFLSGWTHRQFTGPEVDAWLQACEDAAWPAGNPEAVNVREWRRQYDRQTKVPADLVERFESAKTMAREAWVQARAQSDYGKFQPHLATIIDFNRQLAEFWGYEASPYDALLEGYEHGAKASQLQVLFQSLKPSLMKILEPAMERSASVPADLLEDDYPIEAQRAFNREVASSYGFDFEAGRIDTTTHPFCTGLGPGDTRLTTRYHPRDFTQSLYGVLHEVGHGLYDQGLLHEHFGTPLGEAVSLGIHESQSRLWENHVGRGAAFWEYWLPRAAAHFPGLKRFEPGRIHAAVNRVAPSYIRVEADQVTYDLHIILRFEIELKLLSGEIEARDLPACWNETFHDMFGLKVPDDAHGCLQDIHWSLGGLGYFPTYTLGNLNAAQLFRRASMEESALSEQLARGEYHDLLRWLRAKVHRHGCRFAPQDLMKEATGETTQSTYHLEHLQTLAMG